MNWRRGYESNIPRPVERADNGFEDREGHQAPFTLQTPQLCLDSKGQKGRKGARLRTALELCFDGFDDGIEVRKLAGLLLGKQFLSIDADFEDAAARRHKLQRTETLFELQELDRQTDGLGLIVSSGAIFDRNFRIHLTINVSTDACEVKDAACGRDFKFSILNFELSEM